MTPDPVARMRDYWEQRARLNAAWYVDTTLDYDEPDMQHFFAVGERIVGEALDEAPVRPPGQRLAIEIGSGLGRICRALAERFEQVVGLDISAEMVDRARTLVPDPRVRFEVGSGAGLEGVPDACADLVLSFTVFQHIPEPSVIAGYIRDVGRVLAPGGVTVLQWNGSRFPAWWRLRRHLLGMADRLGRPTDPYGRDVPEFLGSRVPVATMRRWLSAAGLQVAAVKGAGSLFSWVWAVRPEA
jgi:SAM-dependent methyltransferase